ncbi:MAG: hypothetical protein R3D59_14690 [Paracoccaceae bacterium]
MVDVPTTKAYQEHILPIGKDFNLPELVDIDNVTIDSQYLALGVAGTYAWGLAANDERSQVAALLATKAVAYSYLTSHLVLKTAFGRLRPVKDLDNPPKGAAGCSRPARSISSTRPACISTPNPMRPRCRRSTSPCISRPPGSIPAFTTIT